MQCQPILILSLFRLLWHDELCKSDHLYELGRHYDSTPNLIGMAGRAEKRERGSICGGIMGITHNVR